MGDREEEKQLELIGGEIVESDSNGKYTVTKAVIDQRTKIAIAREENKKRMGMAYRVAELGKRAAQHRDDPDYLRDCFDEYLRIAMETGSDIGNMTAYAAIGLSHQTADAWFYGRVHKDDPRYRELIYYIKSMCASYREMMAIDGRLNPLTTMFWQKNFDGLTSEGIFRTDAPDPLGDIKSTKEIMDKYKDMPED